MSPPLVSIVIPTYNRLGFVETAIMSVLEQDYPAIELIVLDDGSTDETSALLARIAERENDSRFRWSRHDNVGQGATINRGLAQANGELLGYLSSDDYLLPGAITKLVAAAEANPQVDVVYPWFRMEDVEDRVLDVNESLEHTFVDAVRLGICMPGVGVLVRRRIYERVGGWNESNRFCPDYEWWLTMGDATFLRIPEPLGVWRVHEGSISTSDLGDRYLAERMAVLEAVFARDDLPADVRAVKGPAYAALYFHALEVLILQDPSIIGQRFVAEDVLGPMYSRVARAADRRSGLEYRHSLRSAEAQLAAVTEVVDQLRQTVTALDDGVREREARIRDLEAELAARPAEPVEPPFAESSLQAPGPGAAPARPPLLRAARAVVPARLRPRVGAAVHRVTRRS